MNCQKLVAKNTVLLIPTAASLELIVGNLVSVINTEAKHIDRDIGTQILTSLSCFADTLPHLKITADYEGLVLSVVDALCNHYDSKGVISKCPFWVYANCLYITSKIIRLTNDTATGELNRILAWLVGILPQIDSSRSEDERPNAEQISYLSYVFGMQFRNFYIPPEYKHSLNTLLQLISSHTRMGADTTVMTHHPAVNNIWGLGMTWRSSGTQCSD